LLADGLGVREKRRQTRMIQVAQNLKKDNDRVLERYGAIEYAARWKMIKESFTINHHRKHCNEEYFSGVDSSAHNPIRVSKDWL